MRGFTLLLSLLLLLMGCGGGASSALGGGTGAGEGDGNSGGQGDGTDGDTGSGQASTSLSYAERSAAQGALLADFHAQTGGTATAAGRRPMAGQAIHRGFADITLSGGPSAQSMNGDLDMVVNFGQGTLIGSITTLRRSDDVPLGGTLYVRDGQMGAGGGGTISGRLEGTLTEARGALDFDAAVSGDFYGPSAEFTRGTIAGSVQSGAGSLSAEGNFLAGR
ncbi:hypothetical protein [Profundibacterium mesophilum]|uniref:Prokaryotic membrane lipoprotein lipid attachment site domain containing protein n=1 Tax=Profundibacterium mesophilum KAUST100406-0324 TaxID=1037889 RepID=A0A921NSU3_9RHOB|nr:hypothetical protein [Profundibacterium mesophilum]KAF0674845.1 Prokaryotic membrane lipoprotein lipid attachment site domain containing protein [Profundibacterium mesophilum KAUST100406-0324]